MRQLAPSPLILQVLACALALGALAVQPASAGPVLLVPLTGSLPSAALDGNGLIGIGPVPGSLIVARAPAHPDISRYLVLAAPASGCGDVVR